VATALLEAAMRALRRQCAEIAEGYPTKPPSSGLIPAAFAYTGVPSLFLAAGFECAELRPRGRQRFRKRL
jgi:hypothetical protein